MPVPKGDGVFKVPMPQINTPRFKFGGKQQGGVGHGEGQPGDPVDGQKDPNGQPGQGEAGEEKEIKNLK